MAKSSFVDFKAVKAAVKMEEVLRHYNLLDGFKRSGDSLSGPCPIHEGTNPTQFRVSVSKNLWNCFSECKNGGNVLDFIAQMEDVSIHAAAHKAIEWFKLDEKSLTQSSRDANGGKGEHKEKKSEVPEESEREPEKSEPNKPLKFRLDKLVPEHPFLSERKFTPETVETFGVGLCTKGMMAGRIAIPIANDKGEVVAYAGRLPEEPTEDKPKYKLPPGFRKSLELFNIERAIKEPAEAPLLVVEGFFHSEIESFFTAPEKVATHIGEANKTRSQKEQLLESHERAIQKLRDEMTQTHRLYVEGQVTAQGFGQFYKPAEERLNALTKDLPKLQADVDYLKVNQLSAETVVGEARALYSRWPTLPIDEKRKIAESLCQRITIGRDEIDITLSYLPSSEETCKSQQQL